MSATKRINRALEQCFANKVAVSWKIDFIPVRVSNDEKAICGDGER